MRQRIKKAGAALGRAAAGAAKAAAAVYRWADLETRDVLALGGLALLGLGLGDPTVPGGLLFALAALPTVAEALAHARGRGEAS